MDLHVYPGDRTAREGADRSVGTPGARGGPGGDGRAPSTDVAVARRVAVRRSRLRESDP
jgi:hypothetical protein